MTELIINNQANFNANGNHTGGNRNKPVINLDTGATYASATDAAEALGCSIYVVSACCLGKIRTCKGYHLAYVAHASQNVDILAERIRSMHEEKSELERKAELYDKIQSQPNEAEGVALQLAALRAYKEQKRIVNELKEVYLEAYRAFERENEKLIEMEEAL